MASQLIVYSNKPPVIRDAKSRRWLPNLSGGAVRVILGSPISAWVGPGRVLSDEAYAALPIEERFPRHFTTIQSEGRHVRVFTFPVPKSLHKAHYELFSNRFLWPLHHSTDPRIFRHPLKALRQVKESAVHLFPLKEPQLERAFKAYCDFNAIATAYLRHLKRHGIFHSEDRLWVHDYQCLGVGERCFEERIFSYHIPFPAMDYLQKAQLRGADGEGRVPLLQTNCFIEYVRMLSRYGLITFQRPVDQQNFFELIARLDPDILLESPVTYDDPKPESSEALPPLGITSLTPLRAFGRIFATMNLPVGTSQETNLREAIAFEHRLTLTELTAERLALSGIATGARRQVTIEELLGPLLRGRRQGQQIFLSVHRNDYTKCTMEKLMAAERFLQRTPEALGTAHFLFFLEPTRQSIEDYQTYEEEVLAYASRLRLRYGDSVLVIPQAIDHREVMGLLRQPNVVALLGVGQRDGHDLTLREAADAQADRRNARLAVVTTSGTGASDLLFCDEEGAFVLEHGISREELVEQIADVCAHIYQFNRSGPPQKAELRQRYRNMSAISAFYSAEYFGGAIARASAFLQELCPHRQVATS
jgi:trehalose-6-phosphate synthase